MKEAELNKEEGREMSQIDAKWRSSVGVAASNPLGRSITTINLQRRKSPAAQGVRGRGAGRCHRQKWGG